MAIQNTDLILVGRGGASFSTPASELQTFISSGDALTFRGSCNVTITIAGQLDPNPPVSGDVYINSTAGTCFADWNGISGETAGVGDRVVFDGTQWALISSGAADVGVISVEAANGVNDPITVSGTDSEVLLTVKDATVAQKGVNNLASTPAGDGTIVTDGNLIKEHYDDLLARIGVAAGGGTQGVTGIDPIETSQDAVTHIAEVSIKDGTTLQKGAVQLATAAEAEAGTDTTKALTPAAAAGAFVPLDLSKLNPLN